MPDGHQRQPRIPAQNSPEYRRILRRVTIWGLAGNLLLSLLKFLGGMWGNSQALMADAVHSLSDSSTDVAVLVGARYWTAPADRDHPHGHGRIEALVTLFIGGALGAVGLGLAYNALNTLGAPGQAAPGWTAFAVACLSMVVKELLYRWTVREGRRIRSSALMANAWHHRSDALSSLPVAVAVLGTRVRPDWLFLDNVAAVLVAVFIMRVAWDVAWPSLQQLMDAGAGDEVLQVLRSLSLAVEGVKDVHALRTRNVGQGFQVDMHVLVAPELTVRQGHDVACRVEEALLARDDVVDVLVHVEPFETPCP